ncbi:MAG: hypothetical protein KC503_16890 [Myxococcales bacterium]|nr:hypothetical protein [Myxococcales bacterium]
MVRRFYTLLSLCGVVALLTCGCDAIASFYASDAHPSIDADADIGVGDTTRDGDIGVFDGDVGITDTARDIGVGDTTSDGVLDAMVQPPTSVAKIVYGERHTCALADGRVYCWGDNDRGQCGVSSAPGGSPQKLSGLKEPVRDLCANALNTCAVDADGKVLCWGANDDGQLGATPAQPGKPGFVSNAKDSDLVGCGDGFVCAVTTSATSANIYCWGRGDSGQLGPGSMGTSTPVPLPGSNNTTLISCGTSHCCAKINSSVYCWGNAQDFRLGSATPATSNPLNLVSAAANARQIASHGDHTCAAHDKNVTCWGANDRGQLAGIGVSTPMLTTSAFSDSVSDVSVGVAHSCAVLKGSGAVVCWGDDRYGQLGRGITADRAYTKAPVTPLAQQERVFAGANNTCAVTGATITCWGRNTFGQVGDGTVARVALSQAPSKKLDQLASGGYHVCAKSSGTNDVRCWGLNAQGQSAAAQSDRLVASPRPYAGMGFPAQFGLGYEHSCAVSTGGVICAGRGDGGQLDGTARSASNYVFYTATGSSDWQSAGGVDGGRAHTCALLKYLALPAGVYCWGDNSSGQLGFAGVGVFGLAQAALGDAIAVSAGGDTSCGIAAGGALYCWGGNDAGQLGDGTVDAGSHLARRLGGTQTFKAVSVGPSHGCAIDNMGAVQCWGRRQEGQLANGSVSSFDIRPVVIQGSALVNATAVAVGGRHSCAVASAKLYCWGDNRALQSGGALTSTNQPPTDLMLTGVQDVVAGEAHTCALTTGGARCFGDDFFDQSGNGTPRDWSPHLISL